jgi:DNA-binding NarL/FixJ family response regulator
LEPPVARKPDLLIVDDDPLITDTLEFVLGKDFQIFAAGSRQQARHLITQLERVPGLALVDLGLPPTPHRPDEGFRLTITTSSFFARNISSELRSAARFCIISLG